ncbi:MAG TPA: DUF2520 domain-containing protein [Polyangiaceae bacterium]|jgi:predicted short-subunit dehydrogenase-like oxidoreductase (DUF2520 family)
MPEPRVYIHGAGKVGRALASALRRARWRVTLRAARDGFPRKPIDADVVVLALRDRDLAPAVERLVATRGVARRSVVVHVAGALDEKVLAPLRAICAGVAQMHPMISFASRSFFPTLARGNVHVQGDRVAIARAKKLARALGMTPRHFPNLDTVGYHAAAALLANGAAALAAQAERVLVASRVPPRDAPHLLGPLLRSVAENVENLGFPEALTGPVRRGDPAAVERGAKALAARAPDAVPLYRAAVLAQVPLARALREVPASALDAIEAFASENQQK